jgi:hypothetical protein
MVQKILGGQRDFSYGEVDVDLKRNDDHPARKAGLRQMLNHRIHNSGVLGQRSGRSALYPAPVAARTEELTMSPGNDFKIEFGAGQLRIMNAAGAQVQLFTLQGNGAALPWTAVNTNQIRYAVFGLRLILTFGFAMRPQVITFDGVATWTIADYNEDISAAGQKRTPFYRISPQNITMKPSAISGAITVQFSSPIVVAAMNGTRMRYCGRQILLGARIDASNINATVIESLPPAQNIALISSIGNFSLGDIVNGGSSGAQGIVISAPNLEVLNAPFIIIVIGAALTGATSGATGIVTAYDSINLTVALSTSTTFNSGETVNWSGGSFVIGNAGPVTLIVQLLANSAGFTKFFVASETIASPTGGAVSNAVVTIAPQAVATWDDEVMNAFRGFPASVFVDQFRVGFCDWPAIPGGISWSAINSSFDLYVGTFPTSGMFEIAPNKVRVYDVVPGPEGSEFVFCDDRVYYIPINETNPLKPGSVAFKTLTGDGAGRVQPRIAQEAILYANAGLSTIMAVIATGAYQRPFATKSLTDFHAHLFKNIQCIACPKADGTFNERYAYVLNGDGSISVGKYKADSLPGNEPVIGWGPWTGGGVVKWIHAWRADVLFTSSYFGSTICEILDDTVYLDSSLFVNALPAPFTPPGGKGPLWWIPNQSVFLMDQVTRQMGVYQINGNGFIVPQNQGGENLLAASLVAGQAFTTMTEPFVPEANPGNDMGQRMFPRRVSRFRANVLHSTGFKLVRLFSGRVTRLSPALGAIMNERRFPAYNMDDDATLPPPTRETSEGIRPVGRTYDPRVAIIRDTPGPMIINEITIEATI